MELRTFKVKIDMNLTLSNYLKISINYTEPLYLLDPSFMKNLIFILTVFPVVY